MEDTEYQHKLNVVTEQCFRNDIHKLVLLSLKRVCTMSVFCLFTVNQNMKFGEVRGDFQCKVSAFCLLWQQQEVCGYRSYVVR